MLVLLLNLASTKLRYEIIRDKEKWKKKIDTDENNSKSRFR